MNFKALYLVGADVKGQLQDAGVAYIIYSCRGACLYLYLICSERCVQIAGASFVVVRAAAPKHELERLARNASGIGEGVTSTSAELRGRLEPLVYCRGFGCANVENKEVVDVHKTPFDCGSCARILTAIAALQLWQEDHV
eukprot:1183624-Prorocentrum_minimum.AAC.2